MTIDKCQEVYSLFEGRHELPENNGAIFDSTFAERMSRHAHNTPALRIVIKESLTQVGRKAIMQEDTINLIVTGMTPALCWFINASKAKRINTWHFNRDTGKYFLLPINK